MDYNGGASNQGNGPAQAWQMANNQDSVIKAQDFLNRAREEDLKNKLSLVLAPSQRYKSEIDAIQAPSRFDVEKINSNLRSIDSTKYPQVPQFQRSASAIPGQQTAPTQFPLIDAKALQSSLKDLGVPKSLEKTLTKNPKDTAELVNKIIQGLTPASAAQNAPVQQVTQGAQLPTQVMDPSTGQMVTPRNTQETTVTPGEQPFPQTYQDFVNYRNPELYSDLEGKVLTSTLGQEASMNRAMVGNNFQLTRQLQEALLKSQEGNSDRQNKLDIAKMEAASRLKLAEAKAKGTAKEDTKEYDRESKLIDKFNEKMGGEKGMINAAVDPKEVLRMYNQLNVPALKNSFYQGWKEQLDKYGALAPSAGPVSKSATSNAAVSAPPAGWEANVQKTDNVLQQILNSGSKPNPGTLQNTITVLRKYNVPEIEIQKLKMKYTGKIP